MAIPVRVLKGFSRSPNGMDTFAYQAGEVYSLPRNIAERYARRGNLEILEVVQEKPKRKRKKKKENEDE